MDVFLKESKTKLSTLTDETKVHVVIGNEACDLDSTVSALVYAFYLYSLSKKTEDSDVVYIPVLNIPRHDYSLRTVNTHCLRANQVADDTLVFRDEIDLTTLHKRGQLILTLVDHNVLIKSDAFMDSAIVEIIDHHSNGRHDDNDREIDVTLEMVGSCSTLVAEKILKENKEILDETTTTLLLGTILIDTYNLSKSAQKMTPKDQAVVDELHEMYPYIDRQKLFDDMEKIQFDVSDLSTEDLLRKDYKSLLGETVNIGLSSITLHLKDLLQRPSIEDDLQRFCTSKGLHILCLVNVAVINSELPQRQLGVYSAGFKALKDSLVRVLLVAEAPSLQLTAIQDSPSVVAAFDQGNVAASRKKIMPIVQQFVEDLERDSAHVNELLENKPDCNIDLPDGDFMTTFDPLEANRGSPTTNQNNANDDQFGFGSLSSLEQTTNSMPAQNSNSDDLLSYESLTSSQHIANPIPAQNVNSDDLFSYGSLTTSDHITNYVAEQNTNDPFGLGLIVASKDSTTNNNNAWQNTPESTPLVDPISTTGLENFNDTGPGPPADVSPELTSTNSVQRPVSLLDLDPFEVIGDSASSTSTLASPNLFESTPVTFDPMTTSPSTPSSVQMEEMDDLVGLDAPVAQQSPNSSQSDTSPSLNSFQHSSNSDQNGTDMLGLGHIIDISMQTNTSDNDDILFGVDTSLLLEENINKNSNNLATGPANYQTVNGQSDKDDKVNPQESVHNFTENNQQIESYNSVKNGEKEMEALSSTDDVFESISNSNIVPILPLKVIPKTPSNSVSDTVDVLSSINENFIDSQVLVEKVEELHRSKLRCDENEVAEIITMYSDSQKSVFRREESLSSLGDEERPPSPSTETFSDDGSNSSSGESYTVTDDNRGLDQFVITQIQEVEEEEELSDASKNTAVAKKEKEEILVQEEKQTVESHGIINNLQHNTSKVNIETELSQDNIAMVECSEEALKENKDVTMTAVESGGLVGKTVEEVCDYEETMVQVASTTEAEINSENEEKHSISNTDCVEPLQNGMGEICIGDEQADKVSELQVQDIIDANAAVKNEEKDEMQKENVAVAATEYEEELHDYVENVVQMAMFDYKQDATKTEIAVKDQQDKVSSSTAPLQPLQENASLLSTVDEQLDEDLNMHHVVNNLETSIFHDKEESTLKVAEEVFSEDLSNLMGIEQSKSTVQEGSCEDAQVEGNKTAGGTSKPTNIGFINADVTVPTMLTDEQLNLFRSEQHVNIEICHDEQATEFGGNKVVEDMRNQTAVNVNNEEKCESVEEMVIPEEQSNAKHQKESTSEHLEDVKITADEVSSYVDSVVRLACYTYEEQMQAIARQDSEDPQGVDDIIIEEVNAQEDSAVIEYGISVSQVVEDKVNSQVQTASFESSKEDNTIVPDVPSTDGIISAGVISPMTRAVNEAGLSVYQIAELSKKEDISNEALASSAESEVAEEVTSSKDSVVKETVTSPMTSIVVETAIYPAEMTVTEAPMEPTECVVTEMAISTSNNPITESVISPTEGSMLETAINDNGEITAADINQAAIDRTVIPDSTEENIEDEQRDLIQTMDASSDDAVPSFPYESTPIRPDTLPLSTSRGGKTKIQPNFATSYNSAGTPVSLLSEDGSTHSVMTLDAVCMFPTTSSPGSLSDSEDDLGDDDTAHRKQDSVNKTNLKRLVSVDLAMAEDIGGDWTGEKEILEEVAARQQEKQRQLDLRQGSAPTLKERGRQLSVASAAAKQRMEGVQIPEEWQDDEFHQQKLSGQADIEDDSFYHRSVPRMDNIEEDDRLRLRVDSDFMSRLRDGSDLTTEAGSLPRSFTSDGKQKLRVDSDLKRLRGDSSMSERSEEGQDRSREDSDVPNRTLGKFNSKMRHMSEDSLEDDIEYLQEEGVLSTDEEDADLGARPKKRIPAELNLDGVDQMNGRRASESINGATPSLLTPTSIEMSWDDDGGTGRQPERIPEYTAKQELEDNKNWRRVVIAGKEHAVDMKAINPYKKVLSHGGYYGDGLNAIIVFASCYMPDKSRKDYNYIMHNLFFTKVRGETFLLMLVKRNSPNFQLDEITSPPPYVGVSLRYANCEMWQRERYVVSTLELLVAQDYMIVYFHGASPKNRIPSLGWMRKCYKMIDRKLRKNLKGLFLVHPTTWLKTIVRLTRPFVSSKFSSKLKFIYGLEELEKLIPMDFVYVPDEVRRYDERIKRKENASNWWGWLGNSNSMSDDDFEDNGDASDLSSIDDLDDLLFPQFPQKRSKYHMGNLDFHSPTDEDGRRGVEMSEDSGCSENEGAHNDGVEGGGFMEDDIFAYSSGTVSPVSRTPRPLFMISRRQSKENSIPLSKE